LYYFVKNERALTLELARLSPLDADENRLILGSVRKLCCCLRGELELLGVRQSCAIVFVAGLVGTVPILRHFGCKFARRFGQTLIVQHKKKCFWHAQFEVLWVFSFLSGFLAGLWDKNAETQVH
jgi:hypothetical protein